MKSCKSAHQYKAMITVEEHSVNGGLGDACAGVFMQENIHFPFKIVGIPDEYTVTGNQLGYIIIMELPRKAWLICYGIIK